MRRFALLLLLPLVACATPQQQCLGSLPKEIRILDDLIAETAGNIARGYAITETPRLVTGLRSCFGPRGMAFCTGTDTVLRRAPVAIDLASEKAKLASMQADRIRKQQELELRATQCSGQFPEG